MLFTVLDNNLATPTEFFRRINTDKKYIVFLDWRDGIIVNKNNRISFINLTKVDEKNMMNLIKEYYNNKNCIGFYILSNTINMSRLLLEVDSIHTSKAESLLDIISSFRFGYKIKSDFYRISQSCITTSNSKLETIEKVINDYSSSYFLKITDVYYLTSDSMVQEYGHNISDELKDKLIITHIKPQQFN